MTDYISREVVVNAINCTPFTMSMFLNKDQCVGARQARDSLALIVKKSIPAADVVPLDFHERCLQIEVENRLALEKKYADVRPVVSGKWIGTHDGFYYSYSCSECGYEALYKENTKDQVCSEYCPNCGAWMEER